PLSFYLINTSPLYYSSGHHSQAISFLSSGLFTASALPPDAGTRTSPAVMPELNTMVPSASHVPPMVLPLPMKPGTSVTSIAAPPFTGIFLTLPGAMKASHSPSGEQHGVAAPSV